MSTRIPLSLQRAVHNVLSCPPFPCSVGSPPSPALSSPCGRQCLRPPLPSFLPLQWAVHEALSCGRQVRQRALAPLASASDLGDVGRCVSMVLACCAVLEHDHGLSLVTAVLPELWGHMEGEGGQWGGMGGGTGRVTGQWGGHRVGEGDQRGGGPHGGTRLCTPGLLLAFSRSSRRETRARDAHMSSLCLFLPFIMSCSPAAPPSFSCRLLPPLPQVC